MAARDSMWAAAQAAAASIAAAVAIYAAMLATTAKPDPSVKQLRRQIDLTQSHVEQLNRRVFDLEQSHLQHHPPRHPGRIGATP